MPSKNRLKEIASLGRRKYRRRLGQFLVEGERLVESALAAGAELTEILAARELPVELLQKAEARGVQVSTVDERDLRRISDVEASQGIVAVAKSPLRRFEAIENASRIVVLDGIQDPGNAGTIIRTAAWFGVDAVVAGPGTVDLLNPKTVRATMGGLWDVALIETDDSAALIDQFSHQRLTCYAADMGGVEVSEWKPVFPSILILGSEAHGISQVYDPIISERVHIASRQSGKHRGVESLNVAAAAAILFSRWGAEEFEI